MELKLLLPVSGRQERRFMKRIRLEIGSYRQEHRFAGYQELCEHFGKPQEVAAAYWETVDEELILRRLQVFHVLKWIVIVLTIVFVMTYAIKLGTYFNISKSWESILNVFYYISSIRMVRG